MIDSTIDITLEGDNFSPKNLIEFTDMEILVLAEVGEIAKIGRYKGKHLPYGLAVLTITEKELPHTLDKLISDVDILKRAGVTDITLNSRDKEYKIQFQDKIDTLSKLIK